MQARNIISAPIRRDDFLRRFPSGTSFLKPSPQSNSQTKVEWVLVQQSDHQLELELKILSALKSKLNELKIKVPESWLQDVDALQIYLHQLKGVLRTLPGKN